jgi:hypothetical protein
MPGTISKIKYAAGLTVATLTVAPPCGHAISSEARLVYARTSEVQDFAEQSQALFGEKASAISQIHELAEEYAEQNWDGENALAISPTAIQTAIDFIRLLPKDIPLPEFAPEPDGAISLDWIESRHKVFSLSIGESNRLAFAWLDGTSQGHGVEYFDGEEIPSKVLYGIKDTMNYERSLLRAA